jgi:antitoxin (DNA-binding transcriptional repressor) of toxin-antitoxin stability system
VKTLSVREAASDLATWLKRAIAGEDIAIRRGRSVVALRPVPPAKRARNEQLTPLTALRRLQQEARLTPAEAARFLAEVKTERLAAGERGLA